MKTAIQSIYGREILNSRGKPTVEVTLRLESGLTVTASVPSGASTGKYEALEIYDGGTRYRGFGCRTAAANVNEKIAPALIGMDVTDQRRIDKTMIGLDGTRQKSVLGGNAILGVSMAAARAGALALGLPLYRYLGGLGVTRIPNVMSTVISGGAFSPSGLEFEDYLLVLTGFDCFADQVEAISGMRWHLEKGFKERFGPVAEDGGALAPPLGNTKAAFESMLEAARRVGCEDKVRLGLDVAANELYLPEKGVYGMTGGEMEPGALLEYYVKLSRDYPLVYIEDAFMEDDWDSFARLTAALPGLQIVGDDLFATNAERLKKGIALKAANTLLFKVNQIGTVTEALGTAELARNSGIGITASLRSGETNDDFQADLAVAVGALQMKLGSPVRGERNAKYNRLTAIEEDILLKRPV